MELVVLFISTLMSGQTLLKICNYQILQKKMLFLGSFQL